jgi:hypothetical protein
MCGAENAVVEIGLPDGGSPKTVTLAEKKVKRVISKGHGIGAALVGRPARISSLENTRQLSGCGPRDPIRCRRGIFMSRSAVVKRWRLCARIIGIERR